MILVGSFVVNSEPRKHRSKALTDPVFGVDLLRLLTGGEQINTCLQKYEAQPTECPCILLIRELVEHESARRLIAKVSCKSCDAFVLWRERVGCTSIEW
jgi:hypothetical protein